MIILLLAFVYGFSMHSSQAEDCVRGNHSFARFGPTCEYLCHCGTNQCDRVTGACPNNGECDGGWMGSGCQYVNIAYNTTVNSNHLSNTDTIVDGRRDSCPYETKLMINPAYVMVSFRRKVNITEVNIIFSKSVDVPPPFAVSVSDGNQAVLCGSVDYTNGKKEYVINCSSTLYGQYLNITSQWSAGFNVCEIQVPAGRNLAYGKPAFQSSLLEEYYARNAVDGLTYHAASFLTCTHTYESNNPWWLLDLQASVMMQWFRIFNRPDDFINVQLNERLRNFRILLSLDNVTFIQAYQDQNNGTNDPPLVIEASLKSEVLARFVKIDLQGIKRILTLCEVQVFGESIVINLELITNVYTYKCITGTAPRVQVISTTSAVESTECVPGYYGGNCDKSCFTCKNLDCDKITGRCQSCIAGKLGDLCQIDCADNYYGNCSTRCGHCKNSSICNKINGFCASGLCSEGWMGDKCDIECNSTYYGLNCAQPCGHCLNNTCDRFSGNCSDNGCKPDWQGSRCDILLIAKNLQQQPVTDANVVVIGASVGAAVAMAVIIIAIVICITANRRGKRNTIERNTKTMEMSPNSSNLADINADGPIQTFDNTSIEHPRTYYNTEVLNQNQRGSTNVTSINSRVESDGNLYSHYEKLKHHIGTTESAYCAIDNSQSGHHKDFQYGANLDKSNAYYNIVQ